MLMLLKRLGMFYAAVEKTGFLYLRNDSAQIQNCCDYFTKESKKCPKNGDETLALDRLFSMFDASETK